MDMLQTQVLVYSYGWICHNSLSKPAVDQKSLVFKTEGKLFTANWISDLPNVNAVELNRHLKNYFNPRRSDSALESAITNKHDLIVRLVNFAESIDYDGGIEIPFDYSDITDIEFLELKGTKFETYIFNDSIELVGMI